MSLIVPHGTTSGAAAPVGASDRGTNTLVISDLHLGEDLSPTATEATRLHLEIVERQLVQFLRHYTRRREDGRPWRLVVNGDFIDFLAISIRADHPEFESLGREASPEEREFGLHRTPHSAAATVVAVAARHAEVFRALARFLARGNRLDLVCGNHDAELTWPEPQAAFRAAVARAWEATAEARAPGAVAGEALAARVGFHPWFVYEPGELWIEHGHQYDENCSFEHQLDPRRPGTDAIAMNVDSASTRYISNWVHQTDPHGQDSWSAFGYLRFGAGLGVRGCLRLARAYMRFNAALLAGWKHNRSTRQARDEQRRVHAARRAELASAWRVPDTTLAAVDAMHRPPVVGHLRRLVTVMMLDRIVLHGAGLLLALLAAFLLPGYWALLATVAALTASHFAVRMMGRDRCPDNSLSLEQAGTRLFERIDARYVVFGHSHEPVARPVDADGRTYFNTGTWVPSGRPGILRSFTHLVVRRRADGVVAQLCQWRDGLSRSFTPGWRPSAVGAAPAPAGELGPAPVGAGAPVTAKAAAAE